MAPSSTAPPSSARLQTAAQLRGVRTTRSCTRLLAARSRRCSLHAASCRVRASTAPLQRCLMRAPLLLLLLLAQQRRWLLLLLLPHPPLLLLPLLLPHPPLHPCVSVPTPSHASRVRRAKRAASSSVSRTASLRTVWRPCTRRALCCRRLGALPLPLISSRTQGRHPRRVRRRGTAHCTHRVRRDGGCGGGRGGRCGRR